MNPFTCPRFARASSHGGLLLILVAVFGGVFPACSQSHFYFTFRGTYYETNAGGEIVARPVTEQTLLEEVLARTGITNTAGYAVVYHVKGDGLGDTIDIVNPTNRVTYDNLYGFFFGEAFGRTGLTNATGQAWKRVDYIYDAKVNSHSIGSAIVTYSEVPDAQGQPRKSYQAQMQWMLPPRGINSGRICTGLLKTTVPLGP